MKNFASVAKLSLLALFISLFAACSSNTKVESDLGISGAPNWVNEGTNILNNKDGRLFHGVGSAEAMGDMALQTSVADDRARAEVAKILSNYLDAVSNDYQAASKSGDNAVNEESVSRQIKSLTKVNLAGVRILFELEERMGTRILETLFEATDEPAPAEVEAPADASPPPISNRPTR